MTTIDLSRELKVASEAARAAGAIQMQRYERLERIDFKSEKDLVTEADHLSEEAILEIIGRAFPGDSLLAEESGGSGEWGAGPDRLWVIDPLDGTVNYANGIPFFAVSVGLVIEGEPVLGVVLDPSRGELFSASRGGGAFLDGRPVRCADKERLVDTVVHLGLPGSGFARQSSDFRHTVRIVRSMGSATLAMAYLANGRFDAYVQYQGLSTWDICAAGVIAIEGGAIVTSQLGNHWFDIGMSPKSIGIVAATPRHHAAFLRLLRS
ncbi:MAG: inositol monophosphatase family protein [Candidatus Limnocylindrales bacterium]|jgi:myo-inositol-1(or 4)-monophosphatase